MALLIVLSSSALKDLDAISFDIANDSPAATIRWLESIDETMQLIASHPGLRELVRVIHSARRIEHLEP